MRYLATFVFATVTCAFGYSQDTDCDCGAILRFGREIVVESEQQFALLYDNQIGIKNRINELGGSASVVTPDGLPLEGVFNKSSQKSSYDQYQHLNIKYLDKYLFANRLGPEVAAAWLECMRRCNSGAWMRFDDSESMLLRFGYGDENHYPATVVSVRTTSGIVLKDAIPKKFRGERVVAVSRKDGVNRAEGVKLELELKSGKHVFIEAYLPPMIPDLVHWKSDVIFTRVPKIREADWKLDIPEIPKGTKAVFWAFYRGGSPADRARVTLTARVKIVDEKSNQDVGEGFYWKALGPQTHIGPSAKSVALPSGKYRTEGRTVTERNDGWAGSSHLQMMVLTELDKEAFFLDWNDSVVQLDK